MDFNLNDLALFITSIQQSLLPCYSQQVIGSNIKQSLGNLSYNSTAEFALASSLVGVAATIWKKLPHHLDHHPKPMLQSISLFLTGLGLNLFQLDIEDVNPSQELVQPVQCTAL